METKRRLINGVCPILLALAFLLLGCEQPEVGPEIAEAQIFTAMLPGGDATKTVLSEAVNNERNVMWQENDLVRIVGATQADYRATSLSAERTSATLVPAANGNAVKQKNASDYYEAFYPASLYRTEDGKLILPSPQSYTPVAATDGNRVVTTHLPMYARSENSNLNFQNLCAVLNFKLTGTDADRVSRIEVTSEDSFLCGEFEVAETSAGSGDWHAVMKSSGTGLSKTVALDCTGGVAGGYVQLGTQPTEFCLAVPAGTYAKGKLKVDVYGPADPGNPVLSFTNSNVNPATGSVVEHSKIYSIVDELSEFSLAESSTTLWAVDQTYRIIPSATGISGADISADCEFTYTSDDETIASVDESGLVSPLNAGTAQINVTATDKRTGKSMSKVFTVTVRKITRVTITGVPASVVSGGSFTAYAHAYDDKGTDITAEVKAANGFSWSDTQLTVNVSGSSGVRTLALSATFHGVPVNTSATYDVVPGVGSVTFNGTNTYYLDSNSMLKQQQITVTDTDGRTIKSGLTFQTIRSDLTGKNGDWKNNPSPKDSDYWRPFYFIVYNVGTFKHTFYVIYNGSRKEVTMTVNSPALTLTLVEDKRESGTGTGNGKTIYTMKATVTQGGKPLSLTLANAYSGATSRFTWTYPNCTLIQSDNSTTNPNTIKLQPQFYSAPVKVSVVVRNATANTSYNINN